MILKLLHEDNGEDGHLEGVIIFLKDWVEGWSEVIGGKSPRLAEGEETLSRTLQECSCTHKTPLVGAV